MNRLVQQFEKSFEVAKKKGWPRIYVACDVHETIVMPTWTSNIDTEFYLLAKKTLQFMSRDPEICNILWSCSREELNVKYREYFLSHDIIFDYVNENPECKSTEYADFDSKLYFNVILDDKAGFLPEQDWPALYSYFKERERLRIVG